MISAEEARQKAANNSRISILNVLNSLQQKIEKATDAGLFKIYEYTELNLAQGQQLQEEFIKAGYVCTVKPIKYYMYSEYATTITISW